MSVLTFSARTSILQFLLSQSLFLAIGSGSKDWGTVPEAPDYEAIKLFNEIGRKKITRAFFVNEDDDGEIDMPGGKRYTYSEKPTRQAYLHFMFDYGEGIAESIREIGVFMNTTIKSGLPTKQTFFTLDQIEDSGTLILLEHLETADTFTPNKKGSYGTILSI